MTIGLLTQPYVSLMWGDINLSYYPDGDGGYQVLAQAVSIKLNKGETAPECTFQITPNPIGFQVWQEIKATALSQPFTVTIGYSGAETNLVWKFRFAGLNLTTGHNPKLEINGVSIIKGCWTDNKISYTMEEPVALSAFPQFLQEKAGPCAKDLKVSFTGQAAEQAASIMVKANQNQRTPHVILMDTLRPHGMDLQVGDTMFDGEVTVSYTPNLEGEAEADPPTVQTKPEAPEPAKRKVFILGPGLLEDFNRKQSFNLGQSNTKRGASVQSSASNDTEQEGVVQPDSAPQQETAEAQPTAIKGTSNPSSAQTGVVEGSSLDEKARQAFSSILTSTCNTRFFLVPYMVGIKPRDVIVVPSLAGPGNYLEDWEVDSVTYTQTATGGVDVSVNGTRTYTGEEPMIDAATQEAVRGAVSALTSPAKWNYFYWGQGNVEDYPLGA